MYFLCGNLLFPVSLFSPLFLLGFPLFILSLYIARTIKPFEKALHDLFSHPFCWLFPSVLFASSAPSKFSLSPNDDAKEPHLKAHSGRVRMWKRPFGKTVWAELSPVTGRRQKKGSVHALPLLLQRYDINGGNANQSRKNFTPIGALPPRCQSHFILLSNNPPLCPSISISGKIS